ncbi:glutamate synthase subunit alpha, partial [bacterium]|nr:glutamate synthase subunit alpha [bacterium]
MLPSKAPAGVRASGLYDPAFEHDSCGVGFVARLDAKRTHGVVADAVQVLVNLEHRGAIGGDKATGDGTGLLTQLPHELFADEAAANGFALPAPGDYAVGMVFLPRDPSLRDRAQSRLEHTAEREGCAVLGWRKVPVDDGPLGEFARNSEPDIRQIFLARGDVPPEAFERRLYVIRRLVEKACAEWDPDGSQFYIPSLSSLKVAYKGMLVGAQLATFYPDLVDERTQSCYALIHQRYSTNTFPSWQLAQPFRFLAHNGEINTLRGNVSRMRAREAIFRSDLFGDDIEKLKPIIQQWGSDSAMLDNTIELLILAGRSLPHALMMCIPEAWGAKYVMGEDQRAFYEYHAAFMEPWDGPAAIACTDGRYIGATLDRNGLRPVRYTITKDGYVIMASESGVLEVAPERIRSRGRLQPGKMFLVDLQQHRIVPDNELKARISRQRPYRHWVKDNRIELRGMLMPPHPPAEEPGVLRRKQHAFGYTEEELKMVLAPMASRGQEAVGSMGNDAALAVLSRRPQLLFAYFKQLFAQVTNPPIDPLREELVMSLMSFVGRQRNLLHETPEHCRQLKLHHPILTPEDVLRIRNASHPSAQAADIDILFPADGDGEALEAALDSVFAQAERHIANGASILILTDRHMDAEHAPIPVLLAAAGLHHHLIRRGKRTAAGILVESGEPREVMHYCLLAGYGANAICPTVAFATADELAQESMLETQASPEDALDNYITAVKKGMLKTFSRMGISTLRSFQGCQVYEAVGLADSLVERYFTGTPSRVGGIGLDEVAAEALARHRRGFPAVGEPAPLLDMGGAYHIRLGGEKHLLAPEAIFTLQHACRTGSTKAFKDYSRIVDERSSIDVTLRSLLQFKPTTPIPLDEVEPVDAIVTRFTTGAMSYGSISKEAHETLAIAMNRIGARSNSGEGGEDPARYTPIT